MISPLLELIALREFWFDLMDIGTIGNKFSWYRTIQGRRHLVKRLDRVLVDIQW